MIDTINSKFYWRLPFCFHGGHFFIVQFLIEGLIDDEGEKIYVGLYLEKDEVFPMEVLIFCPKTNSHSNHPTMQLLVMWEVEAKLSNDNKFIILVPELPAGNYDLEIDLVEFKGSAGIFIRPLPENLDPMLFGKKFYNRMPDYNSFS